MRDDELGLAGELPGHDYLLQVAAREGPGDLRRRWCLDLVGVYRLRGEGVDLAPVEDPGAGELPLALVAQHQVLLHAEVHHQTLGNSVRGHAGHPEGGDPVGCRLGGVLAGDPDGAGLGMAHAHDRVEQGVLAVARYAGDAHDLARADGDRKPIERASSRIGLQVNLFDVQHRLAGGGCSLVRLHQDLAPHHHPGEIALIDVGSVDRADHLAAAQHRHPVR